MNLLVDMATKLPSGETSIWYGDMPDTPNNVCVLYHTGGASPTYELGSQDSIYEEPTFQIRIRDTSYSNAITRINNIKDNLDGLYQQTINSSIYYNIFIISDILSLGRDDRNRINLTLNFRAKVLRN